MPDDGINPDSITLEDIKRMSQQEFRQYSFIMLERLNGRTGTIENRLWWILGSIIFVALLMIARG